MNRFSIAAAAGVLMAAASGAAHADALIGSYQARISEHDKFASDGYALDSAAQMVRQDRANYHKFHRRDPDDQDDDWFQSNDDRAQLERMLQRPGAMSGQVKRAILNGEPLIQVDVYTHSVEVELLER